MGTAKTLGMVRENDFRVKKRAGDAGRDGEEFLLSEENFDLTSTGEIGQVDGASVSDVSGCEFVGADCGKVGQQMARVNEKSLDCGFA